MKGTLLHILSTMKLGYNKLGYKEQIYVLVLNAHLQHKWTWL